MRFQVTFDFAHSFCRNTLVVLQNFLTFTPPGLKQTLNIKFPDSRLAVCEKCKKNFKTRDMCRVRNVHTTAPWTTAYICITVDESCTDDDGKFVDKPLTVRMVQWQPYCTKKPFDPKTPVCAACKRTNRTRSFCRERHKHRHLPWCTVYVLLSALDQVDPTTVVAAPSKKVHDDDLEDTNGDESKPKAEETSTAESETIGSDVDGDSDDINEISESRTFLAKVSSRGTSIHWLDLAEYDGSADPAFTPAQEAAQAYGQGQMSASNDPQSQYFAHAMGYAAQQHQNALKSHQQYFFQVQQQRQQQQYAPPPAQWGYNMGQGDSHPMGATAGEAAAAAAAAAPAHQKRGSHDENYHTMQQQQQWAAYYGQQYSQDGSGGVHHGAHDGEEAEHYPDENGEPDEHDVKRQRVV